jgi:predicted RNA-binding protein YlqC (UPF0109 family)
VTGVGDYEDGDVNVVADDYDDDDVNVAEDYVDGDVNVVAEDRDDEDVNGVGDEGRAGGGNRTDGGMPGSVLGYLARSLASDESAVVVDVEERRGSVRLRLHVAQEDMGRVIGRRGRTAQAIRTLVGVAGARDGVQTSVDIVDD